MHRGSPSIIPASLAAGPIFLVSTALAFFYQQLPHPMSITATPFGAAGIALMLVPTIIAGFILSMLPNLLGSRLMFFTGIALPETRARPIWVGAGALMGAAIAWPTGAFDSPAVAFGLIATSACCAALCRQSACWD